MRVLVAEDDVNIRQGLEQLLKAEGYEPTMAEDGAEALALFQQCRPDFVLLDIMMPKMNGYDVCREIRQQHATVPIVFVSAKSEEIDRVLGLELGADDYIMKPFGAREVAARIRAVARRSLAQRVDESSHDEFRMIDLTVYPQQLRAQRGERAIDLSPRDVKILALLARRKGEVVDRDAIFNECWGRDYLPSSRTLDQHISKLRKLVELDSSAPVLIKTVHGTGYRYDG